MINPTKRFMLVPISQFEEMLEEMEEYSSGGCRYGWTRYKYKWNSSKRKVMLITEKENEETIEEDSDYTVKVVELDHTCVNCQHVGATEFTVKKDEDDEIYLHVVKESCPLFNKEESWKDKTTNELLSLPQYHNKYSDLNGWCTEWTRMVE